jgi:hypothetical protein
MKFSGPQVANAGGEGKHSGKHSTAIFPDAIRGLSKWQAFRELI